MGRSVLAVIAGFVTWIVVATVGNFALRAGVAGYAAVEASFAFTLPMLLLRLLLGLVSSFVAGFVCAAVARGRPRPAQALAALLVVAFVPMHAALWARFPLWYHGFFLLSLAPFVLAGAIVLRRRAIGAAVTP